MSKKNNGKSDYVQYPIGLTHELRSPCCAGGVGDRGWMRPTRNVGRRTTRAGSMIILSILHVLPASGEHKYILMVSRTKYEHK